MAVLELCFGPLGRAWRWVWAHVLPRKPAMTFWELYFGFSGRIGRSAFWASYLPLVGINLLGLIFDLPLFGLGGLWVFRAAAFLVTFWPILAVLVKRLHDRDWPAGHALVAHAVAWPTAMAAATVVLAMISSSAFGPKFFLTGESAGMLLGVPLEHWLGGWPPAWWVVAAAVAYLAILGWSIALWLIAMFLKGTDGENRYGRDPLRSSDTIRPDSVSPVDRAARVVWNEVCRLWSFSGRVSPLQCWILDFLPLLFLGLIALTIDRFLYGTRGPFFTGALVPIVWGSLALLTKRFHDCDRTAWYALLALVPVIGQVWFLAAVAFRKGTDGDNRFGRDPLQHRHTVVPTSSHPLDRVVRLTWTEILKLFASKFFLITLLITLVVTEGLGLVGKHFSEGGPIVRFTNYGLWVVSASFAFRVAAILLVAQAAMAMSSEATARTLNTLLCRPIRRIELVGAKILSLVFATAATVAVTGLTGFIVGGTVQPRVSARRMMIVRVEPPPLQPRVAFPTYRDIADPEFPEVLEASKGEIMGNILFGFALLVVLVLAAVSVAFLLGTLLDSAAMAIGIAVGLYFALEISSFIPLFYDNLKDYAYNYPINRIFTLMQNYANAMHPPWDDALAGIPAAVGFIVVFFTASILVFCRRDVTL